MLNNTASGAVFTGNPTASVAARTDFTLASLPNLPSPSATLDLIPIVDHTTGTIKNVTPASISASSVAGVSSLNGQTGAIALGTITPEGRLTLTSGTPVMTTSVAAATTVYYTPYAGCLIPIYDGTNMVPTCFAEVSQATADTTKSPAAVAASSVYDIFCWIDAGTNRCTRGPAWTNDTTRSAGTALVLVNGIYLNNVAITNGPAASRGTYVGTIRSNGTSTVDYNFGGAAAGGTAAFFGVWNAYNRVMVSATVSDTTASWTYNVASTWRAANSSNGNRINFVRGLNEDSVQAKYSALGVAGSATFAACGIGLDSTTAFSGPPGVLQTQPLATQGIAFYEGTPGLGVHYMQAIEYNTSATSSTWYGNGGAGYYQTGLLATMRG